MKFKNLLTSAVLLFSQKNSQGFVPLIKSKPKSLQLNDWGGGKLPPFEVPFEGQNKTAFPLDDNNKTAILENAIGPRFSNRFQELRYLENLNLTKSEILDIENKTLKQDLMNVASAKKDKTEDDNFDTSNAFIKFTLDQLLKLTKKEFTQQLDRYSDNDEDYKSLYLKIENEFINLQKPQDIQKIQEFLDILETRIEISEYSDPLQAKEAFTDEASRKAFENFLNTSSFFRPLTENEIKSLTIDEFEKLIKTDITSLDECVELLGKIENILGHKNNDQQLDKFKAFLKITQDHSDKLYAKQKKDLQIDTIKSMFSLEGPLTDGLNITDQNAWN